MVFHKSHEYDGLLSQILSAGARPALTGLDRGRVPLDLDASGTLIAHSGTATQCCSVGASGAGVRFVISAAVSRLQARNPLVRAEPRLAALSKTGFWPAG